MAQERRDPFTRNTFIVEIDGIQRASFQTASGLQGTIRSATYWEGQSRTPKQIPSGKVEFTNLVLEGGIVDRALYDWWDQCRRGRVERRTISLVQRAPDETEVQRWNIYEAWPVVWRGPEFDAGSNDVATQRLEIAYEDFEMV